MKFTEWINDERYNKYRRICEIYSSKWHSNANDILSTIMDRFLLKNPEIKTNKDFHAIFMTELRWALLTERKNLSKTGELDRHEEMDVIVEDVLTKEDLAVMKVLKNSHFAGIYKNRYINGHTKIQLCKKYKITERQLNKKLKAIENILKESSHNQHRGIIRVLNNKIDKVYHSISAVEKDNKEFNRTAISKIVSGKLKTRRYKNFDWYYISDFKKD